MTDRLDSWKEIAGYLRKSVRTVRRWESDEGLPVHRHVHQSLGTVYAYKTELDAWRSSGRRAARRSGSPVQANEPSIAVLPFTDLGGPPGEEFVADGLTEEIIGVLSKVRSLRVISWTSSMTLKGTRKDVRTIGTELRVQYVLEGSVRRIGDQVRVSARLIDAAQDRQIWSDRLDGTINDIFAIQEQLARTIADSLELQLTADDSRRLSERPLADIHAYHSYLQARQEAYRWRRDSIDHAVRLLQNGLSIVGDNAELYAALGRTHLQYRESGIDFGDGPLREAERCAAKVDALDPGSSAATTLRGWLHYAKGEIQPAVRALKDALDGEWGNPDVLALLANCYLISGRVSHARPLVARLLAVDPLTPLSRCMPGFVDLMDGDFQAAVRPYREMFEMDPTNPMARLFYVWVLALAGRVSAAITIANTRPVPAADSLAGRVTTFLSLSLSREGDESPTVLASEVEALTHAPDVFPRFLAHGYAWRGMTEEAMRWLSVAADRGFINYPFVAEHDPAFRHLTADPRCQSVFENIRTRWESFEA